MAADRPPGTDLDSGSHWRIVCPNVTVQYSPERIWGLQLAGAVAISGMWASSRSMHKGSPSIVIQELRFEADDDHDRFLTLDELEEKFSDKRVKFVV